MGPSPRAIRTRQIPPSAGSFFIWRLDCRALRRLAAPRTGGPAAALILLNLRAALRAPAAGQAPGSGNGNRLAGLGIGTRQREHEQRALLAVAQFNAAPMQLHDALHDQQAQPAILAAS